MHEHISISNTAGYVMRCELVDRLFLVNVPPSNIGMLRFKWLNIQHFQSILMETDGHFSVTCCISSGKMCIFI